MKMTEAIVFRVEPEVKEALKNAAKEDDRPLGNLARKIIIEYLRQQGYLKPADKKSKSRRKE